MTNTNAEMQKVYPAFRYRWCEAKTCYCVGCVNRCGSASVTKEEWEEWVKRNPRPENEPILTATTTNPVEGDKKTK